MRQQVDWSLLDKLPAKKVRFTTMERSKPMILPANMRNDMDTDWTALDLKPAPRDSISMKRQVPVRPNPLFQIMNPEGDRALGASSMGSLSLGTAGVKLSTEDIRRAALELKTFADDVQNRGRIGQATPYVYDTMARAHPWMSALIPRIRNNPEFQAELARVSALPGQSADWVQASRDMVVQFKRIADMGIGVQGPLGDLGGPGVVRRPRPIISDPGSEEEGLAEEDILLPLWEEQNQPRPPHRPRPPPQEDPTRPLPTPQVDNPWDVIDPRPWDDRRPSETAEVDPSVDVSEQTPQDQKPERSGVITMYLERALYNLLLADEKNPTTIHRPRINALKVYLRRALELYNEADDTPKEYLKDSLMGDVNRFVAEREGKLRERLNADQKLLGALENDVGKFRYEIGTVIFSDITDEDALDAKIFQSIRQADPRVPITEKPVAVEEEKKKPAVVGDVRDPDSLKALMRRMSKNEFPRIQDVDRLKGYISFTLLEMQNILDDERTLDQLYNRGSAADHAHKLAENARTAHDFVARNAIKNRNLQSELSRGVKEDLETLARIYFKNRRNELTATSEEIRAINHFLENKTAPAGYKERWVNQGVMDLIQFRSLDTSSQKLQEMIASTRKVLDSILSGKQEHANVLAGLRKGLDDALRDSKLFEGIPVIPFRETRPTVQHPAGLHLEREAKSILAERKLPSPELNQDRINNLDRYIRAAVRNWVPTSELSEEKLTVSLIRALTTTLDAVQPPRRATYSQDEEKEIKSREEQFREQILAAIRLLSRPVYEPPVEKKGDDDDDDDDDAGSEGSVFSEDDEFLSRPTSQATTPAGTPARTPATSRAPSQAPSRRGSGNKDEDPQTSDEKLLEAGWARERKLHEQLELSEELIYALQRLVEIEHDKILELRAMGIQAQQTESSKAAEKLIEVLEEKQASLQLSQAEWSRKSRKLPELRTAATLTEPQVPERKLPELTVSSWSWGRQPTERKVPEFRSVSTSTEPHMPDLAVSTWSWGRQPTEQPRSPPQQQQQKRPELEMSKMEWRKESTLDAQIARRTADLEAKLAKSELANTKLARDISRWDKELKKSMEDSKKRAEEFQARQRPVSAERQAARDAQAARMAELDRKIAASQASSEAAIRESDIVVSESTTRRQKAAEVAAALLKRAEARAPREKEEKEEKGEKDTKTEAPVNKAAEEMAQKLLRQAEAREKEGSARIVASMEAFDAQKKPNPFAPGATTTRHITDAPTGSKDNQPRFIPQAMEEEKYMGRKRKREDMTADLPEDKKISNIQIKFADLKAQMFRPTWNRNDLAQFASQLWSDPKMYKGILGQTMLYETYNLFVKSRYFPKMDALFNIFMDAVSAILALHGTLPQESRDISYNDLMALASGTYITMKDMKEKYGLLNDVVTGRFTREATNFMTMLEQKGLLQT